MIPAIQKTEFEIDGCQKACHLGTTLCTCMVYSISSDSDNFMYFFNEHMTSSKMTDKILCPLEC